ncbi:hypothetical protein P7K49_027092 [Saguinus oedipus]|uniref:Uncharacterized protein n=1 Tax=Saguinus oedipus TaxID=9490 RepID=A0ABQ9UFK2_SAGOE|nr:hypothetical protein P7K49_027092 [Saguinus oedipus]
MTPGPAANQSPPSRRHVDFLRSLRSHRPVVLFRAGEFRSPTRRPATKAGMAAVLQRIERLSTRAVTDRGCAAARRAMSWPEPGSSAPGSPTGTARRHSDLGVR